MKELKDPAERTAAYRRVNKQVEKEVEDLPEVRAHSGQMGYCHLFWAEKQRLLREHTGSNGARPPR